MKNWICSLIFLFCGFVQAGVMNGGGGKGVVCRDANQEILSVELLDLWEARVIYNRIIPLDSNLSLEDEVDRLLNSVKNSIFSDGLWFFGPDEKKGAEAFKEILKIDTDAFLEVGHPHVHWLEGTVLEPTQDSFEVVKPAKCKIEQIVRYTDTNQGGDILVNSDLVDRMDDVNKAALYVHEALYAYFRRGGEQSSIRVRRAVGLASSGYQFINPETDFEGGKPLFSCFGANNVIHIYESKRMKGTFSIYPDYVAGRTMLGYEGPNSFKYGTLDEMFPDRYPNSEYSVLGKVGFDYNYRVDLTRSGKGEKIAHVYLMSAPDQKGESAQTNMTCAPYKSPVNPVLPSFGY